MTGQIIAVIVSCLLISATTATWTRSNDPYRQNPLDSRSMWEATDPRRDPQQQLQQRVPRQGGDTIWDIQLPLIHSRNVPRLRGSMNTN